MAYTATIKIPGKGECYGVASAPNGELYVSRCNSIYKVDNQRRVTLFAGSGGEKHGWREGPALQALFNRPSGLMMASNGDLYICDFDNHRIRRIREGIVTTLAGSGHKGWADSSSAATAKFNHPVQITERDGYLFVTDLGNKCIRVIDLKKDSVTSLFYENPANNTRGWISAQRRKGLRKQPTQFGLGTPSGIAFSKDGALYITDRWTHSIHKAILKRPAHLTSPESSSDSPQSDSDKFSNDTVNTANEASTAQEDSTTILNSSVDDSSASSSAPADPSSSNIAAEAEAVAVAPEVEAEAARIPALVGAPAERRPRPPRASSSAPSEPEPIECPWIVESITKIAGHGAGFTDTIQIKSAQFRCPTAITIDRNGTLFIADRNNHTIRFLNDTDGVMTEAGAGDHNPQMTIDGHPSEAGTSLPTDLCMLPNGDLAWVEATGSLRITTRDCEDSFAMHVLADHRIPGFYDLSIKNEYWSTTYNFNEEALKTHPWIDLSIFKQILEEAKTENETELGIFVDLVQGAYFPFCDFASYRLMEASLTCITLIKKIASLVDQKSDTDAASAYVVPIIHWLESVFKRTSYPRTLNELFAFMERHYASLSAHPNCFSLLCTTIRNRVSWRTTAAQKPEKRLEDTTIPRSTPEEAATFQVVRALLVGNSDTELPVPIDYDIPVHTGWTPITRPLRDLIERKQSQPDWIFTIAGRPEEYPAHSWFLYTRWNFFYRLMDSGFCEVHSKRTELPADFPPAVLKNVIDLIHFRTLNILSPLDHNDALFILERGEEFDWKTTVPSESLLFQPLYIHAYAALELALKKHEKPDVEHTYEEALLPIDTGFDEWEEKFNLQKYAPLFPDIELPTLLFQMNLKDSKESSKTDVAETPVESSSSSAP